MLQESWGLHTIILGQILFYMKEQLFMAHLSI